MNWIQRNVCCVSDVAGADLQKSAADSESRPKIGFVLGFVTSVLPLLYVP